MLILIFPFKYGRGSKRVVYPHTHNSQKFQKLQNSNLKIPNLQIHNLEKFCLLHFTPGGLRGGHIFRLASWVVLDKSILLKTDELGTNFKAMDELEILRMLCKVAVEQDKQITEQEKAIRELSDEVNEILEVMMDGQSELGD